MRPNYSIKGQNAFRNAGEVKDLKPDLVRLKNERTGMRYVK